MASAELALVCGLKVRVGCQDKLCVNSDADEALADGKADNLSDVLPHSYEKFMFRICFVTSENNFGNSKIRISFLQNVVNSKLYNFCALTLTT